MADRTVDDRLTKYPTDVHSIEVQALARLEAAPGIAAESRLSGALEQHLEEARDQERRVRDALGP